MIAAAPALGPRAVAQLPAWRRRVAGAGHHLARTLPLAAAVGLASLAIAASLPPAFRAAATLQLPPAAAGVPVADAIEAERARLLSRDVALRAIVALRLWDDPEFDPRQTQRGAWWTLRLMMGMTPQRTAWTDEKLAAAVQPAFARALAVAPAPSTTAALHATFDAGSPHRAAQVLAGLMALPTDGPPAAEAAAACGPSDTIERALRILQAPLPARKPDAASPASPGELAALRARRVAAEPSYQALSLLSREASPDYLAVAEVRRHPLVVGARQDEDGPARTLAALSVRLGAAHPQVVQVTAALDAARRHTAEQAGRAARELMQAHEALRAAERRLAGETRPDAVRPPAADPRLAALERLLQADLAQGHDRASRPVTAAGRPPSPAATWRVTESHAPGRRTSTPLWIAGAAALLCLALGLPASVLLDRLVRRH